MERSTANSTHVQRTYERGEGGDQGVSGDSTTRTYLWKAAGIRMPDDRRIIVYLARWVPPRKFKLGAGRPFWRRARMTRSRDPRRLRFTVV